MNKHISLLFAVTQASAVVSRRFSAHGLSFADFMIMHYLDSAPEQKLRRIDLAEKLGLTPSGITRLILPLEKIGIIKRLNDDADARARFSALTKAGKDLLNDATATLEERAEELFEHASEKTISAATELLLNIK
jgi:DNA-binding MarR family transcriptional regulator